MQEDRRTADRRDKCMGMEISLFGCGDHRRTDAQLCNYGDKGVCVLSHQVFPHDAIVFLRVKGLNPTHSKESGGSDSPRNGALGKIRWIRFADENEFPYKMGIQYYPLSEVNF